MTTERDPLFFKANGDLTEYALTCGYIQSYTSDGKNYYGTDGDRVALLKPSPGGGVYDVRSTIDGAHSWEQFDTYAQARTRWGILRRQIEKKHKGGGSR